MKPTHLFITSILTFITSVSCLNYSDSTYNSLVQMAGWCSVSYCIEPLGSYDILNQSPDLKTGYLPTACPTLEFCDENPGIEIVQIFEPIVTEFQISGSGFIALDHTNKRILVVFKGSSTVGDWIEDFTFLLVPYVPITQDIKLANYQPCDGCLVHQGIYMAVKGLSQQAYPTLDNLVGRYPDYQVITTGHSLGGGLTSLAGVEFQLMGFNTTVYSFAGLKIGNVAFGKFMDLIFNSEEVLSFIEDGGDISTRDGYVRVVHRADIVPLIPPTPIYAHGGVEFYINKVELPHPPSVVELTGLYVYQPLTSQLLNILDNDSPGTWLTVYEHNHYFIDIYGCNSSTSITDLLIGAS